MKVTEEMKRKLPASISTQDAVKFNVDNVKRSRGGNEKVPNTVNGSDPWIPSCSEGASPLNIVNVNAGGEAVAVTDAVSLGVTLGVAVLDAVTDALFDAVFEAVLDALLDAVTDALFDAVCEAVLDAVFDAVSLADTEAVPVPVMLAVFDAVSLGVAVRVGNEMYAMTTEASAPTSAPASILPSAKQ